MFFDRILNALPPIRRYRERRQWRLRAERILGNEHAPRQMMTREATRSEDHGDRFETVLYR